MPVPVSGTVARVRAVVETDHRGPADLHVGAAAVKRVWWNGGLLETGGGYLASARVEVERARNVLEYELSDAQDRPQTISGAAEHPAGQLLLSVPPGRVRAAPAVHAPARRRTTGRQRDLSRPDQRSRGRVRTRSSSWVPRWA